MPKGDKAAPAKRPRGRPKGTAVYAEQDLRALAQYADVLIEAPRAQLTRFLRSIGYENDKDIRRVRIRWGVEKERLLREARERRDASPTDTLLEWIAGSIESLSALKDVAAPAFQAVNDSLERARTRLRIMKELGLNPDLPLDLEDQEAVAAAVGRYEARMFRSIEEKAAELPPLTQDKLPAHLKIYMAAVLLHELSLQMAGGPAEEATGQRGGQTFDEGERS